MQSEEIRNRFLEFFKKHRHVIIPSASLIPENDSSVLFITAGMQPLVPYLMGQKHPEGKRLANVQKCVRMQDIEEVGDATHDTFFEMLGNWSLGDYFKNEAIKLSYEFLINKNEGLGLSLERLYITVFSGDENVPKDTESANMWKSLGILESHIFFFGKESNWWSLGDIGPCGPDTEMFYDIVGNLNLESREDFIKADKEQKIIEIWNDVFMEYERKNKNTLEKLSQKNVDTGAGLERLAMIMQMKDNIFDTDLFEPLMKILKKYSAKKDDIFSQRIIADHVRTAVFIISDGITPSKTDKGYVLRRLVRRAHRKADLIGFPKEQIIELVKEIEKKYKNIYANINNNKIISIINKEIIKSEDSLKKAYDIILPQLKIVKDGNKNPIFKSLPADKLFQYSSTYGVSLDDLIDMINDLRVQHGFKIMSDKRKEKLIEEFNIEQKKHQEISRVGSEKKFKGGLADTSKISIKYHTTTHLLHQALKNVLGEEVEQKGSNITQERLRFDFSFNRKMTDEEKICVEEAVNKQIANALPVTYEDITQDEAKKIGALGIFLEKYGNIVRVYKIGDYSLECCGGPHVKNTKDLGNFKIKKEEAVSSGIRRIKAVLE